MDQRFEFLRRSSCRVVVARGAATQLPALLAELDLDGVVVLHDATIGELAQQIAALVGARAALPLPDGEAKKTLPILGELAARLRQHGATRRTALLSLGGGSTSDLVGFLAAVFLRGVPFVACPTTTLAACDAAIGGKTGVDHGGLKNELGTIRQPDLVLTDTDWLTTLPDALWREGFVEVIKKAAVLDAANFAQLETLAPKLRQRVPEAAAATIAMAIAMKLTVVQADETERDRRAWLNFGHTLGHALESLADGALRHGECVARGMLAECRAAQVAQTITERLERALHSLGVDTAWPERFRQPDAIWALASKDKKAAAGNVPMIVPNALGHGERVTLARADLARALS
jgi:3-dehydroquinate synthetase